MPQTIVYTDEQEDRIVKKYATKNNISKAQAIKDIIRSHKEE